MLVLTLIFVLVGSAIGGRNGIVYAFHLCRPHELRGLLVQRQNSPSNVQSPTRYAERGPRALRYCSELTNKASLPMPKVYIIENDTPNAFATGRNPEHAAVAVTTGILRMLSKDELPGVIGHELSHIRHRDILICTIAATMAGAIAMLARMAQFGAMFGGGRSDDEEGRGGNFLFALIFSIVGSIAAMLIQMAISRSREYLADQGGAHLSHPLSLAKALGKLDAAAKRIPMDANPSTAHMFIVNPLTGEACLSLFSTHPPIEERIARLEEMARTGKF